MTAPWSSAASASVARRPHGQPAPTVKQLWAASGASTPCRRTRVPPTSSVSPSMTRAGPDRSATQGSASVTPISAPSAGCAGDCGDAGNSSMAPRAPPAAATRDTSHLMPASRARVDQRPALPVPFRQAGESTVAEATNGLDYGKEPSRSATRRTGDARERALLRPAPYNKKPRNVPCARRAAPPAAAGVSTGPLPRRSVVHAERHIRSYSLQRRRTDPRQPAQASADPRSVRAPGDRTVWPCHTLHAKATCLYLATKHCY